VGPIYRDLENGDKSWELSLRFRLEENNISTTLECPQTIWQNNRLSITQEGKPALKCSMPKKNGVMPAVN
jgi:hypothetical protein